MKKLFTLFILCLAAVSCFTFKNGQAVKSDSKLSSPCIYYADRRLHCLIPLDYTASGSAEKTAKNIVAAILRGKDENSEILRIIPNIENGITVKVKNDTAYVNLSSKLRENITKNRETERLAVYQLVNSLTSVNEINSVRFTVDGKTQKDFLGFLDMREIFTANYDI